MSYTLREIATIIQGQLLQDDTKNHPITDLLYDSRRIIAPESSLFIAIVTPQNNGHHFLDAAYQAGVRHFLVSQVVQLPPDAAVLLTTDTLQALQTIASYHRQQFKLKTIAITGSNGKTIVKEWLHQLLQTDYYIVKSPKSFNSQLGVPLSLWQINEQHQLGLFEAGVSLRGEMQRLEKMIAPNIGVFTNIGEAHSAGFASIQEKANEKAQLFKHCETIIYCADYQPIERALKKLDGKQNHFKWSFLKPADLQITHVAPSENNLTRITARYKQEEKFIELPFADEASIENAMHCWATMLYLGYGQTVIRDRIRQLTAIELRLELKAGVHNCLIINDSYNTDLRSLQIALDFLVQQSGGRSATVVLSDILQSGKSPRKLYTEVAAFLAEKKVNRLIGIGKEVSSLSNFLPANIEMLFFENTEAFLEKMPNFQHEIILLKGARAFRFERVAQRLAYKLHRTVLEIDLSAMAHNFRVFRSKLRPETKMMVMVKASGYGSGGDYAAKLLAFEKADYLAVAYTDEGIELRESGCELPIMVMNIEETAFEGLLKFKLEPEIYSLDTLFQFLFFIKQKAPKTPYRVHLKLDTGMYRLGFAVGDIPELCEILKNNKEFLEIASIFTHLVATDNPKHDDFTRLQAQRFSEMCAILVAALGYQPLRHILNSSGISRFTTEFQLDMVRLGIGLYGVDAILQPNLQTVFTLKATISQLKTVPAGETVGYNRMGKIKADTKVATVTIGYADGLSRRLSNGKGGMYLHGKLAPIIGNVCMDMCMLNVTHIPQAAVGDEVIIFGEKNPVQDLAKLLETIPYEIFTNVSNRVKRVYFQD